MAIEGSCFCGSISYRINGTLRDARSCHCSRCRKAFSAQASAYALVDSDEFEWRSGADLLTFFGSEENAGLAFCSRCGSTLCGMMEGKVHGVTLGCVSGDPGIQIERHIYVGSRASWEVMPDGVTQFEEGEENHD